MAWLTEEEARVMLEGSGKQRHSELVARIMEETARQLSQDPRLWGLVGLLHDVDHEKTRGEPRRHGLVAAEWLQGRLPAAGLHAIKAHDYQSGVRAVTLFDRALVFADSLALLVEEQGLKAPYTTQAFFDALLVECRKRPFLGDNILRFAEREGLTIPDILNETARAVRRRAAPQRPA